MIHEDKVGLMNAHMGMLIDAMNKLGITDADHRQRTLLYVFKRLEDYDPLKSSEKTFMWNCCKIGVCFKRKWGHEALVSDTPLDCACEPFTDETPLTHLLHRERIQTLSDALKTLPDRMRLIVELYYWERWTLAHIGCVTGVSLQMVHITLDKAYKQLRSRMKVLV